MIGIISRIRRVAVDGLHAMFRLPFLESALTRFTTGKEAQALSARLAPSNTSYRSPSYRFVRRDGIQYRLDISDYTDWIVYWGTNTERPTRLFELAFEGAVVVDIGTNLGEASLNLAKRVGPTGKVFGFEPDPVSFAKLSYNLSLNPFGNVVPTNVALGDAPGLLTMKVACSRNRGANRITRDAGGAEHFTVKVDTLDRFIAGAGIARCDLIKIDVEGFEISVLRGARETLNRFRPMLFIEISDPNQREQGSSAAALVSNIESEGYDVFDATTEANLHGQSLVGHHDDAVCRPRT